MFDLNIYFKKYLTASEDLESFAEELRPHTERAMKIEVAPWIKDYEIDMDKLYTELTLEKVENEAYGLAGQKIESYKCLFDTAKPSEVPKLQDFSLGRAPTRRGGCRPPKWVRVGGKINRIRSRLRGARAGGFSH